VLFLQDQQIQILNVSDVLHKKKIRITTSVVIFFYVIIFINKKYYGKYSKTNRI
jgi:hypothetical protein